MKRIHLALGHVPLEEYLKNQLNKEYIFSGLTVYRDGVIKNLYQSNADILIIRETLKGSIDMLKLIHDIRRTFPNLRIVFIAGQREVGDTFLATLVSYGVYDILYGDKVDAERIVHLVRKRQEYKDVMHLQPVIGFTGDEDYLKDYGRPNSELDKPESIVDTNPSSTENSDKADEKVAIPFSEKREKKQQRKEAKPVREPIRSGSSDFMNKLFGSNGASKEFIEKTIQSKQVFSFLGGKTGVGNTTLAYNTAVALASKKYNVIFIEIDENFPSVPCWLNIGYQKHGIDSVLSSIEKNELFKIDNSIIKTSVISEEKRELQEVYQKLPQTLDFMFFSDQYLSMKTEIFEVYNFELIKEMILYLAFQKSYDFIVLDIKADCNDTIIQNALTYSNKAVISIVQDISSINYGTTALKRMSGIGLEVAERPIYVVNKFMKSKLTEKHLKEWLEVDMILTTPNQDENLVNSNLIGLPLYVDKKNTKYRQCIDAVVEKLTRS